MPCYVLGDLCAFLRGIILFFFDFQNCLFEGWDVVFDCFPNGFSVHTEVRVDEFISHSHNFFPWKLRIFCFEGIWKFFGCFSNDFDTANHGVKCFSIFDEFFVGHVGDEFFNVGYCFLNVL